MQFVIDVSGPASRLWSIAHSDRAPLMAPSQLSHDNALNNSDIKIDLASYALRPRAARFFRPSAVKRNEIALTIIMAKARNRARLPICGIDIGILIL